MREKIVVGDDIEIVPRKRPEKTDDYLPFENVENGTLTYTDELIAKAEKAFGVKLVKNVPFDEIENVAEFIINEIINKNIG